LPCTAQVPQGFNYQAIVRDDGTNQPIVSQPVLIRITIEDGIGTDLYQETHSLSTDEFGIVSIIIGQGTPWVTSDFNEIDWNDEPLKLKTEVQYPVGGSYTVMGTAPLMSVPYAMVADSLGGPLKNLKVKGTAATPDTEALFEVKNISGQTIFAVYNEGVRIYVNDVDAKGAKGGFAIGGFGMGKTIPHQYMFISGDSVRINIDNGDADKGPKGGFAIGGFGTVKGLTQKYLMVSNDSVRIYVDNAEEDKGPKGGFAIGGYGVDKGKPQKLLTVSNDSVRIYINDGAKGPKGGFAIGGFDQTKGSGANVNFFNVSTEASDTIDPSEPRILWYPLKNAFLTGQVLIELSDSVGVNSTATGFESKAVGDWSQAMGYQTIARGDYSTAIGKSAIAHRNNSFAFGDNAKSTGTNSFSFGKGATAVASGSYAIGSQGFDDEMNPTRYTIANGVSSFAIGMGAQTSERLAIAIGTDVTASGVRSVALGSGSEATAFGSVALGTASYAYGTYSFAANFHALASGSGSVALAYGSEATGYYAVAAGMGSEAQAYNSFVIGRNNLVSGTKNSWVATDPLFVIGNGSSTMSRANALTLLKNGNIALGHSAPEQQLDLSGQIKIRGGNPGAGKILTSDADGDATWELPASHTHSTSDISSGTLSVTRGGTGAATLTANKLLAGNGTSAVSATLLHWDSANSRMGVADASPSYTLDVAGQAQVQQSAWLATGSGNVGIGAASATYKLDVTGTARTTAGTYLATSSGSVGIGTTTTGTYKMKVLSTTGGVANASSHIENSASDGVALIATTTSTDGTALFDQRGTGYSLRCDVWDPSWGVAFIVKGRNVGINTGTPGQKLDIIGGNGRVESSYSWLTNSDARYKKNITELQESLLKVMSIRGVRFDLSGDEEVIEGKGKYIGFIAQELEEIFPEFVVTGDDGYKAVAYDKIGPVLVEAIKEQQEQIEAQQQQIDQLMKMVIGMKEQIASSSRP